MPKMLRLRINVAYGPKSCRADRSPSGPLRVNFVVVGDLADVGSYPTNDQTGDQPQRSKRANRDIHAPRRRTSLFDRLVGKRDEV